MPSAQEQVDALGAIDYNFHVKPILSRNCFACHGPDPSSREAELQLHTEAGLYAPLRDDSTRSIIVPGEPHRSELIRRVSTANAKDRMPPRSSHRELTPYDIAVLRRWVEQGAAWKPHWAFLPPEAPADLAEAPLTDAIDRMLEARLTLKGLQPTRPADAATRLRRLSFDLTGLPPTVDELSAFLDDERPDAYARRVDSLLASPHFGERMAQHWMDVARYADTNGYSIDGGRHQWVWRDWVIRAFNDNLPFDRFVVEQLAGDLLPEATEPQRVATGFNRNHMITHEGGTIPEENLHNYVVDRVKTTGEVFLGLTLACAQCHDHKFDPVTQREYYQFYAFFNGIQERGLDGDRGINAIPSLAAHSPLADRAHVSELEAALVEAQADLSAPHEAQKAWEAEQRQWIEARRKGLRRYPVAVRKVTTPNTGYTGLILPDSSVHIDQPGWLAAYNLVLQLDPAWEALDGLQVVFYPHPNVNGGRLGYGAPGDEVGDFVLTTILGSAAAIPQDQVDFYDTLPIRHITATSARASFPVHHALDETPTNGWSPEAMPGQAQHLTLTFATPLDVAATPYLTLMLGFGQGDNAIAGHFKVFGFQGHDDGALLPPEVEAQVALDAALRDSAGQDLVRQHFVARSAATARLRAVVANLEERITAMTTPQPTLVMAEGPARQPTHVLNRGQYDQPGELVQADVPAILPSLAALEEPTRLDLAQWLVRPDHPLTARVAVNRFWEMLFGRGLVATSADFGAQGGLPSHPALLDALARSFIESGWDVKAVLRAMVLTEAYQRSSVPTPTHQRQDPLNRWLARGPRQRLQAEFIRDAALRTSGLLVDWQGGPSVQPYQPGGLWKEVSHYGSTPATAQNFVQDHAQKLYRRSLYTYWKRTAPPPSMVAFDAPTREVCTITREVTNTPLQALVLMNDPQFVEASRALAGRLLRYEGDDAARMDQAFLTILSRQPHKDERRRLLKRLEEERLQYRDTPTRAYDYLALGESPRDDALDPAEHAAWTTVASILFNLSEAITKL